MGHQCQPVCYQEQEALRNPVPYETLCTFVSSTRRLPQGRRTLHSAKHVVGVLVGILCLVAFSLLTTPAGAQAPAAVPVFQVTPGDSTITFHVNASVIIEGTFDQWQASLTFTSPAVESAVLDVQIQAASVNTGSDLKNDTPKGKDFFNVEEDPVITFRSTAIVQTGPGAFDVPGTFTSTRSASENRNHAAACDSILW